MAEPSSETITRMVREMLSGPNFGELTVKKIREKLESDLNCSLASRKKELKSIVETEHERRLKLEEDLKRDNQKKAKKEKKSDTDDEASGSDEDSGDRKRKRDSNSESDSDHDKKLAKRLQEEEDEDGAKTRKTRSGDKRPKKKVTKRKKRSKSSSDDSDGSDSEKEKKKKKRKSGGGGGYMKTCRLSEDLAGFLGEAEMPRHEVVKRMWAYVKEKNLLDPKNKQFALCDSEMIKLMGQKRIRMFGIMKHLSKHFNA